MKKIVKPLRQGQVIPFAPIALASNNTTQRVRVSLSKQTSIYAKFISSLVCNDFPKVIKLINQHGEQLVIMHSYCFSLPLHIAALHQNIPMMNYLMDKGACPKLAITHPKFISLPNEAKKYLQRVCQFKNNVMKALESNKA